MQMATLENSHRGEEAHDMVYMGVMVHSFWKAHEGPHINNLDARMTHLQRNAVTLTETGSAYGQAVIIFQIK